MGGIKVMKCASRYLPLVVILVLAALVIAIEPWRFKPSRCVAQTSGIVSHSAQGQKITSTCSDTGLKAGDRAPDITLPDLSGKTWSFEEYKKSPNAHSRLLYVFTIMNCEPCRQALKFLADNALSLQDIEVVVISFGPKKLTMRELERMPLPFLVLCDEDSETYVKYHLADTPTLLLVEDGIVTYIDSKWDNSKQKELMEALSNP